MVDMHEYAWVYFVYSYVCSVVTPAKPEVRGSTEWPGYELSKLTGSQLPEMTTATRGPDVANNVRCSNKQLTAVVYVLRTLYYVCLRWQLEEGMTASIPEITAASDLASIPDIDDP